MHKAWDTLDVVESHPDQVSGAWVFRGTHVPVAALFENLRDGATVAQFLEWFPGVERAQVEAVLDYEVNWGRRHECGKQCEPALTTNPFNPCPKSGDSNPFRTTDS